MHTDPPALDTNSADGTPATVRSTPLMQRHGWATAPFMRRRMGRGPAIVLGLVGVLLIGIAVYDLVLSGPVTGAGSRSPQIPGADADKSRSGPNRSNAR